MGKTASGLLMTAVFVTCACSHPVVTQKIRDTSVPIYSFSEVHERPQRYSNKSIIVGGEIIATLNHANESTTIVVLAYPLDNNEKPMKWENSEGRFMATIEKFLDPFVYRQGRSVTVAGIVSGVNKEPVGKMDYSYVVLKAREIHLWPEERTYRPSYYPSRLDYPFSWGPFWGPDFHEGGPYRRTP